VVRELILVRVRTPDGIADRGSERAEILADAGGFVYEGYAIEARAIPKKLNEFVDVMRAYGQIDVTRSGTRWPSPTENKKLRLQPRCLRAPGWS